MMKRNEPRMSLSELREVFEYHPDGHLIWKRPTHRAVKPGTRAGNSKPNHGGYYTVSVLARSHPVHRIIYYMHTGDWPQDVDHINRIRTDNRIENLRGCSHEINMQNRSEYVPRGVVRDGGKYRARVRIDDKWHVVGSFDTSKEARDFYKGLVEHLNKALAEYA